MSFGTKDLIHNSWHKTIKLFWNKEHSENDWMVVYMIVEHMFGLKLTEIDWFDAKHNICLKKKIIFGIEYWVHNTVVVREGNEVTNQNHGCFFLKFVNIKWLQQTAKINCIHEFSLWTTANCY